MATNFTKVLPHDCTSVTRFRVKGKSSTVDGGQHVTNIPFNTANAGATFQDQRYGKGMRLHNARIKDGKQSGFTCTVCGRPNFA